MPMMMAELMVAESTVPESISIVAPGRPNRISWPARQGARRRGHDCSGGAPAAVLTDSRLEARGMARYGLSGGGSGVVACGKERIARGVIE